MSFVWSTVKIERRCKFSKLQDGYAKINESPPVSNGVRASSFEIWTANLAQLLTVGTLTNSQSFISGDSKLEILQSRLPRRHPETWHSESDADISDMGISFLMLLFLSEKNPNLLNTQEHCIRKLEKIWSKLKLLFGVYYWFLKLYTRIIWHSYFPSHGIS